MPGSAALDRLMSLSGELHLTPGEPRRKFNLDHMRSLLAALGNPEKRFPSVLIAGTNGKGSTAATLASILRASGYRTGLYTSPHLSKVNERIRIDGAEIGDGELFQQLARVEDAAAALIVNGDLPGSPSFFEAMTAIAMLAFARGSEGERAVDIAVLEVGMGGRLDATNVVEPLISVITDISLDHMDWLGNTIGEIAREKAGILRPGGTMITLPQHSEANQAIGEVAEALHVRGVNAADYLPWRGASAGSENHYVLTDVGGEALFVKSPLQGQHQQRNLALAIAAAVELRTNHGYYIAQQRIERGIRETSWPGRFELIAAQPGRPVVLLDVAHNPAGAWSLRASLSQLDTAGPRVLIFGCMRDKALAEMAKILFPIFDHVYLAELPSVRAASGLDLVAAAEPTGVAHSLWSDPRSALAAAVEASLLKPGTVLVAGGSVVLVGSLRSLLL